MNNVWKRTLPNLSFIGKLRWDFTVNITEGRCNALILIFYSITAYAGIMIKPLLLQFVVACLYVETGYALSLLLHIIEFVFLPVSGIIRNIIFDPLVFCCITDNVFVKTGLPAEFQC